MSDDLCFGLDLPDTDIEFEAALDGAIGGLGKMQAVIGFHMKMFEICFS